MATRIVMPRLGDFMTEGTVVRLAKAQGDNVGQGEVIAEIETDKAVVEFECGSTGHVHVGVVLQPDVQLKLVRTVGDIDDRIGR